MAVDLPASSDVGVIVGPEPAKYEYRIYNMEKLFEKQIDFPSAWLPAKQSMRSKPLPERCHIRGKDGQVSVSLSCAKDAE